MNCVAFLVIVFSFTDGYTNRRWSGSVGNDSCCWRWVSVGWVEYYTDHIKFVSLNVLMVKILICLIAQPFLLGGGVWPPQTQFQVLDLTCQSSVLSKSRVPISPRWRCVIGNLQQPLWSIELLTLWVCQCQNNCSYFHLVFVVTFLDYTMYSMRRVSCPEERLYQLWLLVTHSLWWKANWTVILSISRCSRLLDG